MPEGICCRDLKKRLFASARKQIPEKIIKTKRQFKEWGFVDSDSFNTDDFSHITFRRQKYDSLFAKLFGRFALDHPVTLTKSGPKVCKPQKYECVGHFFSVIPAGQRFEAQHVGLFRVEP